MKTTVEISEPLLRAARKVASRDRTTLRALIEQGLRQVLDGRQRAARFKFRNVTFKGKGLTPEAQAFSWDQIRELAYKGRGA